MTGVEPYALNTALFSDYAAQAAHDLAATTAQGRSTTRTEAFEFPVGTIISKTFLLPCARRRLPIRGAAYRRTGAKSRTADLAKCA
jgi:hypothetical protein